MPIGKRSGKIRLVIFKRRIFRLLRQILIVLFLGGIVLVLPRMVTAILTWNRVDSVEKVAPHRVAIVFGAGLWRDGSPTPVLRDRVETAARLYFSGKVEKLLMSGDNSYAYYNEPKAMHDYARELGVPEDVIVLDYAGRSTYDTCYRAQEIFAVDDAILVTQSFHLPRALFICQALGMATVGVPADIRWYRTSYLLFWNLRELPATFNALVEVYLTHPKPILGEREPIFKQ